MPGSPRLLVARPSSVGASRIRSSPPHPRTAARRSSRASARRPGRPVGPVVSPCGRPSGPPTPRAPASRGCSRLIQLHFFNTAGDAAVAISLAGTLFFQVPSGEARGQVALFLALTMLPFAIVAPLIGPFLDRFAHGRRWAIGATMAIRAFLCWVLAGAVVTESPWLFAAALGVLVSSKAYGVTRAAAVPRLLPRDFTLVKANGRVSLSGIDRRRRLGPDRRARVAGRPGVVAALRVPAVRDRHGRGDPAARPGRLQRGRGGAGPARRPRSPRAADRSNTGSRRRSPSRCAPTAGRAGSPAS